tara:strand:+ start:774 stop:1016 length:243 start_codon:yes stop_codon:yes gene_type:complete
MDNIFNVAVSFIGKLTNLLIAMLSLGIVAEILYGSPVLGMSVMDNVINVIDMFGSNGVVGLIALVILYQLLDCHCCKIKK